MATTSPDNLKTPDAGDQYALVQDMGALADTVQNALVKRANAYRGTSAQRIAFTTAPEGTSWQDTNGNKFPYLRQGSTWVRAAGQVTLASGNSFMTSATSWSLSEGVSAQPSGIVLVWSTYDVAGGVTQWSSDFIPKAAVALAGSGRGWTFHPGLTGNSHKYLYISDNSVVGFDANATGANRDQALRAVIGV